MSVEDPSGTAGELAHQVQLGSRDALATLFSRHKIRLWNTIQVRLDARLLGRVDADDILQEAYIDAADRIGHFCDHHSGSIYVWLRMIVCQTLMNVHRRHLGTQLRDAARDVSIFGAGGKSNASTSFAFQLLGRLTSPSRALMRQETVWELQQAVSGLSEIDREILTLRHFEQLSNKEVAEVLGIQEKAASIRYVRAIRRLKDHLEAVHGSEGMNLDL